MFRWFEHRQVYVPSKHMTANPQEWGFACEDVYFTTADGVRLHGWFFPAQTGLPRSHLALLVLHGNGGNICNRLAFCEIWMALGANVFLFDYRGYGQSDGRPSEDGTYRDAQAAYEWLRARGFAPENIVVLGKSLGGGVASELALRVTIRSLVLQSTFCSIPHVGGELFPWLPVGRFHTIKYDTLSKLPRIRVPLLIMHSRRDQIIGFHHAERNFAAANDPKMFWEIHGNHTGVLAAGAEQYAEGLETFFSRHVDAKAPPIGTEQSSSAMREAS